jgi:hypothetical protein
LVYNEGMRKAGTLLLLALLSCSFLVGRAFGQQRVSVTVFPFTGDGIPAADLESLTLAFEDGLAGLNSVEVIDQPKRERVLVYLDPSLLACADLDCMLKAGKVGSATAIALGGVSRSGSQFVLTAKVVDVGTGRSRQAESAGSSSVAGLRPAAGLLASTLFGSLASEASGGAQVGAARQQGAQQLQALESLAANLRRDIEEINRQRASARRWGWILAGVGVASAGLAATSWYLAEQAYENYRTTGDIALAAAYRAQVTMWDTITLVSAGTGVLSLGVSIPFLARGPSSRAEKKELKRIETEISALQNAMGETR